MTEGAAGTPLPNESDTPPLPDFLASCLADNGLLTTFRRLPAGDQENFSRWVAAGMPEAERIKRSDVLVDALRLSPLGWMSRPNLPNGL